MPVFIYKGRNNRGNSVSGRMEAITPEQLADELSGLGIIPITIEQETQVNSSAIKNGRRFILEKISDVDLIFFSRQMYSMLRAGVPIMQALDGLIKTTKNKALVKVIQDMRESLNAGLDVTAAVAANPKVFSRLYVSMIQVGEATGVIAESFLSMANFLQQEKDIKDKVKAAARYPFIVIIAIAIAMFVINLKVIPAFSGMFSKMGAELPFMTQVLISVSHFFIAYWYVMLASTGLFLYGLTLFRRTNKGRLFWDKSLLRFPVFGSILQWALLARFARALAATVKAGVPVAQALPLVGSAVDNVYIEHRVREMENKIAEGLSLSRAAELVSLFPPLVIQMLHIGEDTGELDHLFTEVADYYEREVDYNVKNLSAVIEPVLIVLIGIMVLVMALGVFLPMWNLLDAAKHR